VTTKPTQKEYQLLRGGRGGVGAIHPSRHPRLAGANPLLIRTEMRQNCGRSCGVGDLSRSDACFALIYSLRYPPQGEYVHRHNDGGDVGGLGQGLVMDPLVADLGVGSKRCSGGRGASPQQLRLQLDNTILELPAIHRSGRRRDGDDLGDHLVHRHVERL